MSYKKAATCGLAVAAVLVGFTLYGSLDAPRAGGGSPVAVIMRCAAMGEPTFAYQVVTLSVTPGSGINVQAGTEVGEGDDCAVAISEIVDSGLGTNSMTLQATESSLVVTFVD